MGQRIQKMIYYNRHDKFITEWSMFVYDIALFNQLFYIMNKLRLLRKLYPLSRTTYLLSNHKYFLQNNNQMPPNQQSVINWQDPSFNANNNLTTTSQTTNTRSVQQIQAEALLNRQRNAYKIMPSSVKNHLLMTEIQQKDYPHICFQFQKRTGQYLQQQLAGLNNKQSKDEYVILLELMVILVDLNIEISPPLFNYLMHNTLFSDNIMIYKVLPKHIYQLIEWLVRNSHYLQSIINDQSAIQSKLKIYIFFKLVLNKIQKQSIGEKGLKIRVDVHRKIVSWVVGMDFSNESLFHIIRIFDYMFKLQAINFLQSKVIETIESQLLYFDFNYLLNFILTFPEIILQSKESTLLNLLDIISFNFHLTDPETQQSHFFHLLHFSLKISSKNQQLHAKVQSNIHSFFAHVFKTMSKNGNIYSRNFIFQFLIEASKEIQLRSLKNGQDMVEDQQAADNFFIYLNNLILQNKNYTLKNTKHNFNVLFELLNSLIGNGFIHQEFQSQLKSLLSSANIVLRKHQKLKQHYLLNLLKQKLNWQQKMELLSLNEINIPKFYKYMQYALKQSNLQAIERIYLIIIDTSKRNRMYNLKRILSFQQYEQIMISLIEFIVDKDQYILKRGFKYMASNHHNRLAQTLVDIFAFINQVPNYNHSHLLSYLLRQSLAQITNNAQKKFPFLFSMSYFFVDYVHVLKHHENLFACPYYYYILNKSYVQMKSPKFISIFELNFYKILSFMLVNSQHLILNSIFLLKCNSLKLDQEINRKFRGQIYIKPFQNSITRYRLYQFLSDSQQLKYLYDKIVQKREARVYKAQWNFMFKKYNKSKYFMPRLVQQELSIFFMQNNGMNTFLYENKKEIYQIIENATEQQLSRCLYNFIFTQSSKKKYFFHIFHMFLQKIVNIPKHHCLDIIDRFLPFQETHQVLNSLIRKMLIFYTNKIEFYTAQNHKRFTTLTNLLNTSTLYQTQVKQYFFSLKNYIARANYISKPQRFQILKEIMLGGQYLSEYDVQKYKKEIFQSIYSFYLIIHHEKHVDTAQFQALLSQYLFYRRLELKKLHLQENPQILDYIRLRYQHIKIDQPSKDQAYNIKIYKNSFESVQQEYLKKIQNIYPEIKFVLTPLFLRFKSKPASSVDTVIAFYPNKIKPIKTFLQEYLSLLSQTKHSKLCILDSTEQLIKIIKQLQHLSILPKKIIIEEQSIIKSLKSWKESLKGEQNGQKQQFSQLDHKSRQQVKDEESTFLDKIPNKYE